MEKWEIILKIQNNAKNSTNRKNNFETEKYFEFAKFESEIEVFL